MSLSLPELAGQLSQLAGGVLAKAVPAIPAVASVPASAEPAVRLETGLMAAAPVAPSADTGAPPASPAPLPGPVQVTDPAVKGYNLDACVPPSEVVATAKVLDQSGFALDAITGVDWLAQQEMELVYDYFHPVASLRVVVRTRIPRGTPQISTISEIFPGANWHEREAHDFFGITFQGHPDLSPFLLPEDADYHPLRKDFVS